MVYFISCFLINLRKYTELVKYTVPYFNKWAEKKLTCIDTLNKKE